MAPDKLNVQVPVECHPYCGLRSTWVEPFDALPAGCGCLMACVGLALLVFTVSWCWQGFPKLW